MNFDERARAVLAQLSTLRAADAPTHGGKVLSYVYDSGRAELDALAAAAIAKVQSVNGLDPTVFTSVAQMERELIDFARSIFHGEDAVGTITSGGTESCLLAVKAARDHAGLMAGEGSIVVPTTAHAAFLKAAELLAVRVIRVSVDPLTTAVTASAVAAALAPDTFLIVASAPNYPTGVADPIVALGELARQQDLALHVDACLGGFALAWWPQQIAPWDLSVPGVSSLSADLHKYGYSPKGASVVLHTDRDRHRAQFFATTDWPGYPVVNPTLLGSRSAAGLAASWAIVSYLGNKGFAELTERIQLAASRLIPALADIEGLRIVGDPIGPVFAVAADGYGVAAVDPHRWAQTLADYGFYAQLQPYYRQPNGTRLPATTHLTVTPVTADNVDDLIAGARAAAEEIRGEPPSAPPQTLAALAAGIESEEVALADVLDLPSEATEVALVAAGIDPSATGAEGAEALDMASVIAAVEVLPRPVTAKMLIEFLATFTAPPPDGNSG